MSVSGMYLRFNDDVNTRRLNHPMTIIPGDRSKSGSALPSADLHAAVGSVKMPLRMESGYTTLVKYLHNDSQTIINGYWISWKQSLGSLEMRYDYSPRKYIKLCLFHIDKGRMSYSSRMIKI